MNPASGRLLLGWAIPLSWGKNLPNSVVWGVWTSGNRPKSWAERCCSCFGRTADACRVLHGRHGLFFVASTVWSWQKSIPQNWKKQVPPKNEQNSRVILPRDPKILHACWSHWFTRETLGLPALRPSSFEGPVGTFNLWQGLLGLAQDGACIYIYIIYIICIYVYIYINKCVYIYICISPSLLCQRWIPPKCGVSRLELELLKFEDHQKPSSFGSSFYPLYIK